MRIVQLTQRGGKHCSMNKLLVLELVQHQIFIMWLQKVNIRIHLVKHHIKRQSKVSCCRIFPIVLEGIMFGQIV
ncbi:hypothetical protein RchiOBHm_Chr2g0149131 [Rosa chinensis]|uniref:Uncharacterized protein n=1 Tax=Rosa chinensis TaxID=74649 RepID=A0A2P6RZK7_ROSCH|nr:hypothetical protein RchiOBHm_Chr5g0010471 [Rosa chinensis]PRQ51855.1 hypothetical protein RchiOBHm_Chr2g0149131 [Rosa chinensis]